MPRAHDDRLRALHVEGLRPVAIALELGTTPDAVRAQLVALGLRPNARPKAIDPVAHILAVVERPAAGCWIWDGPMHSGKHPAVTIGGVQIFVARALWEHFVAPAPRQLRSTCGERRCVRPEHRAETSPRCRRA